MINVRDISRGILIRVIHVQSLIRSILHVERESVIEEERMIECMRGVYRIIKWVFRYVIIITKKHLFKKYDGAVNSLISDNTKVWQIEQGALVNTLATVNTSSAGHFASFSIISTFTPIDAFVDFSVCPSHCTVPFNQKKPFLHLHVHFPQIPTDPIALTLKIQKNDRLPVAKVLKKEIKITSFLVTSTKRLPSLF